MADRQMHNALHKSINLHYDILVQRVCSAEFVSGFFFATVSQETGGEGSGGGTRKD
jgi:hypothetical protein